MSKEKTAKTVKVTLVKSPIGTTLRKRETLKGLGLSRMNKSVELKNSAPVRGMINSVIQMVQYEFKS